MAQAIALNLTLYRVIVTEMSTHTTKRPREPCGSWTIYGPDKETKHIRFLRLKCKCWKCPRCGPKKAKQLRYTTIQAAQKLNLKRLLTLTLDPAKLPNDADSIRYLKECWSKFRVYLGRKYQTKVSFIAFMEIQKNGRAHLHILVDRYMPQTWVSQAWQSVGGGRIVDIRVVDIHRVALYVSKYLTKNLLDELPPRARRYSCSRNIQLFSRPSKDSPWKLIKRPMNTLHGLLANLSYDHELNDVGQLETFLVFDSLDAEGSNLLKKLGIWSALW